MKLSRHFHSAEFRSHDGTPTPHEHLRELRDLCSMYLEPLRREFGITTVHSGHRSQAHNRKVGGAPFSRHLHLSGRLGAAADVSCQNGSPKEWYDFLDRMGAGGLGLYSTFVHVDNRTQRSRW